MRCEDFDAQLDIIGYSVHFRKKMAVKTKSSFGVSVVLLFIEWSGPCIAQGEFSPILYPPPDNNIL